MRPTDPYARKHDRDRDVRDHKRSKSAKAATQARKAQRRAKQQGR